MSIYATLWALQFPRDGDLLGPHDWIEVRAQGVPGHIGSPSPGCGYEDGDPYAEFLPPAVACEGDEAPLRAVVFVTSETKKGTARSAQEYIDPLLVLSGEAYSRSGFAELHKRLCEALRGGRPRGTLQMLSPDGSVRVLYEDGSQRVVQLIEPGLEAREKERIRFFELADRLTHTRDLEEQSSLKRELARMTFGE